MMMMIRMTNDIAMMTTNDIPMMMMNDITRDGSWTAVKDDPLSSRGAICHGAATVNEMIFKWYVDDDDDDDVDDDDLPRSCYCCQWNDIQMVR